MSGTSGGSPAGKGGDPGLCLTYKRQNVDTQFLSNTVDTFMRSPRVAGHPSFSPPCKIKDEVVGCAQLSSTKVSHSTKYDSKCFEGAPAPTEDARRQAQQAPTAADGVPSTFIRPIKNPKLLRDNSPSSLRALGPRRGANGGVAHFPSIANVTSSGFWGGEPRGMGR